MDNNTITTYMAGKNDFGKPCVWMTIPPDENCPHPCHYIVQECRTMEAAEKAAQKWQRRENKENKSHI